MRPKLLIQHIQVQVVKCKVHFNVKAFQFQYDSFRVYAFVIKGGKEAQLSQIQHSLGKMGIRDEHDSSSDFEPKTLEHNHPENLPRDTVTGNPSSRSSSYVEKISSSASAIADKAADVITSKLGYSSQTPSTGQHETGKSSGAATDYAHKITDTVTGTLAPVYEKVVDAGSAVMSKVQGSVSGTGQPQVQRGSDTRSGSRTMEKGREADKGVSVKEYLVETLKPGDEDKALSDVITHAFHRGNHGESEKKSGEDRPIDRVTESVEVRERLGSDHREEHEHSGNVITADKGVADRLIGAMGSWFGGKGNVPQGSLGTSFGKCGLEDRSFCITQLNLSFGLYFCDSRTSNKQEHDFLLPCKRPTSGIRASKCMPKY
uniref:LTI65/LTI78 PGEED repeat domain-containing protein n=1 Tax=Lactuca sativa TaxID=4236 RepID=A0A9R1XTE5_LACSA|nr:hypothetical protein LSAT_V11C200099810 [Lactuca sativa]